jgi:hypothetical protein
MAINYDRMMRRVSAAKANKENWRSQLDECYKYFMPDKNLYDDIAPGQEPVHQNFDSTAQDALSDYASRMESQLVPPGREWMKLEAGSEIPADQRDEIDKQLEATTEVVFQNINSSNFSSQINECFLDLGISTGALIVEEGDGIQSSLRFRAVPLAELFIERSVKGIIESVWREFKIPAGDIPEIFPLIKRTDDMKKAIKEKPETLFTLIEGTALNPNNKTYTTMVLYPADNGVLYESTEESSPWVIFRESTRAGESYGRGRAMRCLDDARTLNKAMQYYIETCELLGSPIYLAVDDGVINPHQIKIRPKTIIPVGDPDTIHPLPVAGSPELNIDLINRLQDSIRRTMLSKPFGQIDETPVRTATEMSIRNADLAETSMSASGRIQTELLERLIARCVWILKKLGKVADIVVDGKEVAVKYTSPSARLQDEDDLAVMMRFMEIMAALPPELVNMTVKVEDFPANVADKLGMDKSLIRSQSEQKEKEAEMIKAKAEMMDQGAAR